jgi:hypothetical protein
LRQDLLRVNAIVSQAKGFAKAQVLQVVAFGRTGSSRKDSSTAECGKLPLDVGSAVSSLTRLDFQVVDLVKEPALQRIFNKIHYVSTRILNCGGILVWHSHQLGQLDAFLFVGVDIDFVQQLTQSGFY